MVSLQPPLDSLLSLTTCGDDCIAHPLKFSFCDCYTALEITISKYNNEFSLLFIHSKVSIHTALVLQGMNNKEMKYLKQENTKGYRKFSKIWKFFKSR